jgi:hypothetical protein
MNTYTNYDIKLPSSNNNYKMKHNHYMKRKEETTYNLQTNSIIFDPNSISSSPPYDFMNNLKKRMESYYIYSQSVE